MVLYSHSLSIIIIIIQVVIVASEENVGIM